MIDKDNYLFYVQRQSYTIHITNRKEGYNICTYQMITSEERIMCETSTMKIFHRLVSNFSMSIDDFSDEEIDIIVQDIETMSEKLMITEAFAASKMLQFKDAVRSHNLLKE